MIASIVLGVAVLIFVANGGAPANTARYWNKVAETERQRALPWYRRKLHPLAHLAVVFGLVALVGVGVALSK